MLLGLINKGAMQLVKQSLFKSMRQSVAQPCSLVFRRVLGGAGTMPGWVKVLGTPWTHGLMSAAALLGPGRDIVVAGWRSAAAMSPDMNTLVGLGATAAFGVSCVAAALPALGWRTFFEEPAMLLGVVLLGRTLERRAKLQASADMAALRVGTLSALLSGMIFGVNRLH